jgi:3',5'-cyclic-AMP phosphodiesterase
MTSFAQLSDPHLRAGHDDRGAARALEIAVAAVLDLRPHPDAVLVSGDVGEHGDPAEYAMARELLAPLPMPVHVLAGNHDDPELLSEAFGTPARYTVEVGELALVACDTPLPGRLEGELDLDWLEAQLEATRGRPVVIAMHHPPLLTGIPVLDEIGLPAQQRVALAKLCARFPDVRRVVAGHVHRTAFAVLGGCGVVTAPSTNLQARLEIGGQAFEFRPEPPGFLLHVDLGGELVTHVQTLPRDSPPTRGGD